MVDDEPTLLETVGYNLRKAGYEVRTASDGPSGLEAARRERPDLVILDLMLPGFDGFEVCRHLRRESAVPVLMLSALGEEVDKVVGLELGADDYLTKPFSMRELLARVKALLRRVELLRESAAAAPSRVIVAGDLRIDLDEHRATLGGRALTLKPKEFDLLAYLARSPGRVHTRETILQHVWDYEYVGDTRTVDVHIRWLREKIEADPSNPKRIETVRGVGYRFAP